MLEWKKILESDDLRLCSIEEAQAKKVYPNRLAWLATQPKIGAVAVFQSQGADFALGSAGLDYIVDAVREQRIEKGFVLLLRKDIVGKLTFVNAAAVEEVKAALQNNRQMEGKWGAYWWLPADPARLLGPEECAVRKIALTDYRPLAITIRSRGF